MKKILKSILIVLVISVAILGAAVFLLPSSNLVCSAVSSDTTHMVTFYSGDDILYTIEVPDGQSLNDLANLNLVKSSDFSDMSTWNRAGSFTYSVSDSGLQFSSTASWQGFNTFIAAYDSVYTVFIKGKCLVPNTNEGISGYTLSSGIREVGSETVVNTAYFNLNTTGDYTYSFTFDNSQTVDDLRLSFTARYPNQTFLIEYITANLGNSAIPYFSETYINKLYRLQNNLSSSDVFWSTSESVGQFDFSQPITKDTNIYGYEELEFNQNAEQLEAEVSYQPSYYLLEKAIDNIEYIHYKGQFKFNVSIDTSKLSDNVQFLTLRSSKKIGNLNPATASNIAQTQTFDNFSISNIGFDDFQYLNFAVLSDNNSIYAELKNVSLIPTYTFYLVKNTGNVNIIFSPSEIYFNVLDFNTGETKPIAYGGEVENYIFYNGTEINDMNSNTNYFLNFDYLTLSSNYYLNFSQLLEKQLTTISMTYNYNDYNNTDKYLIVSTGLNSTYSYYFIYQSDLYTFTGYDKFELIFNGEDAAGITFLTGAIPEDAYTPLTTESGFSFSQFDIIVRKPVARVDNSLVIFNYGYNNFLNSVTQTRYELRRGINYYDVVYNGQLENSKMIVIDNEYVRNSLFDEYIFVSFIIDGDKTTTYDIKDGKIGTYLGFDFNFVYYTQPLIAGNASYDLMQYRPEYMDGTPSLVPLNIPFTAWIYNAFLWLIFDCPLISDILGFLHLQSFMGALLNILDLYVNSGIGQFVLACLSFIIFWLILKSLMPSIVGGLKSSISTAYKDYNDNKMEETALKMNIDRQQMRQKGRYKAFKFNKGRLNYHKKNGLSNVHHRMLVKKYFTGSFKSSRPKFK